MCIRDRFTRLNAYTFDSVYICGLEIEEDSGRYILEWLQQHPEVTIYFAPGPRICKIPSERMQALLRMHAILHINEEEALSYTHSTSIQQAATMLYAQSHAPIIITLGANGVYFYDGMQAFTIPSPSVQVTDTIGAGDTHIGALLALRHMKKDWPTALFYANHLAAKVVSHVGADLRKEEDVYKRQCPAASITSASVSSICSAICLIPVSSKSISAFFNSLSNSNYG